MFCSKRRLLFCFVALLFIGLTMLSGCNTASKPDGLENVTVTLDWVPNTNHTGLYTAKALGYYEEEGLDVDIVQLSSSSVEQLLATGSSDFGVTYQEAITYARLSEIPVVSIAAVIQHNASGFASLKSKGIVTPKDFEGMRYGGWGAPAEEATIKSLMDQTGADFSKVEMVITGESDFFASSEKDADFFWVYYAWDVIAAQLRGIELNYIDLAPIEPALDYYTPVIATGEALIDENPELIKRFMRATAKGYQFAMDNPDEAASILLEYAPELDSELVRASQNWLKDHYQADADKWGIQSKEVWENYALWLLDNGLVDEMLDAEQAFTNDFI